MSNNVGDRPALIPLFKPGRVRLFLGSVLSMIAVVGCRQVKPTPYDALMKQLHPGMTYDAVVARLGKPYLPEYNVENHVTAIYRADGTAFPFFVQFQKVEMLVIHDPSAVVDSWCSYAPARSSGDSSVFLFAPKSMTDAEKATWISAHAKGLTFPGRLEITDADPNRPDGDGGLTKLVQARSVHVVGDAPDASSQVVLMDRLNLRLVCHPVI